MHEVVCVRARACVPGCAHALVLKSVYVSVRNYLIGVSRFEPTEVQLSQKQGRTFAACSLNKLGL